MSSNNPSQPSRGTQATQLGQSTVHYHTNASGATGFFADTDGKISSSNRHDGTAAAFTGVVANIIKYGPKGDNDALGRLSKRAFDRSRQLSSNFSAQPLNFVYHANEHAARRACESNESGRNLLYGYINQNGISSHHPNETMDPAILGYTEAQLVDGRIPVELINSLMGEGDDCDKMLVLPETEKSYLGDGDWAILA